MRIHPQPPCSPLWPTFCAWLALAAMAGWGCTNAETDAPPIDSTDVEADAPPSLEDTHLEDTSDPPVGEDYLEAGAPRYATRGEVFRVEIRAGQAWTRFQWSTGPDGPQVEPTDVPSFEARWETTGRHPLVVTAESANGRRRAVQTTVVVTEPAVFAPAASSSVAFLSDGSWALTVNEDADLLTAVPFSNEGPGSALHLSVCRGPRQVATHHERVAVSCPASDTVFLLEREGDHDWHTHVPLELPWGSRPHGVVFDEAGALVVTEQGRGRLSAWTTDGAAWHSQWAFDRLPDARGLSRLPEERWLVTAWRGTHDGAPFYIVDPAAETVETHRFPLEEVADTSVSNSGIPTWLESAAISPDGLFGALGGLQANVVRGLHRNGRPLTFETTLRAILIRFDPATGDELPLGRRQFDNRGLTSAVVLTPRGDTLYVAHRGSRAVERMDRFTGAGAGALLDVGFAPSGLAISPDGRWLAVESTYSREVRFFDLDVRGLPIDRGAHSLVREEPLPEAVLRGAQLFNDSFDPRLARDGYVACAHCHLDGDADRFIWDFTDRGEGLRRTMPLIGRGGMAHGPLHWSANFDELQDFEGDIRLHAGGHGLLADDDWNLDDTSHPLGRAKEGLSAELDALAAYLTHLQTYPRSPHRTPDGSLTPSAERGRALFLSEDVGCTSCHHGPHLTDSAWIAPGQPRLHDVGTLASSSGSRLHGPLEGIDTPTLHGLWDRAPYLHNGRASTLLEVFTQHNADDQHGRTSHLSESELADLVAWLLSLEGPEEGLLDP